MISYIVIVYHISRSSLHNLAICVKREKLNYIGPIPLRHKDYYSISSDLCKQQFKIYNRSKDTILSNNQENS